MSSPNSWTMNFSTNYNPTTDPHGYVQFLLSIDAKVHHTSLAMLGWCRRPCRWCEEWSCGPLWTHRNAWNLSKGFQFQQNFGKLCIQKFGRVECRVSVCWAGNAIAWIYTWKYTCYIYTVIIGIYNLYCNIYFHTFLCSVKMIQAQKTIVFTEYDPSPPKNQSSLLIASHDTRCEANQHQYQHNKLSGGWHIEQPTLDLFKHISGWWFFTNPSEKYANVKIASSSPIFGMKKTMNKTTI